MLKHELIALPNEIIMSPAKLFSFISVKVFGNFLKSGLGIILCIIAAVFAINTFWIGQEDYLDTMINVSGTILLLPLVISVEEFFHAASCIARGKKSALNNLIIANYEKRNLNLFTVFVAVDYRGRFNIVDKLYISAAGPITTICAGIVLILLLLIINIDIRIVYVAAMCILVPCIALIPNSKIVQSDGTSILDAVRRLRIPWHVAILEIISSVKYPAKYCFSRVKEFPDNFINPSEALREIEKLLNMNRINEAIQIYKKLVKIDPYNPLYNNNIAWLYYELGEYNTAIEHSKLSLRLSPSDSDFQHTYRELNNAVKNIREQRAF